MALFCLCFVFRSLEFNCPQQRRYSSRDSISQKISLERSLVSRLVFVCAQCVPAYMCAIEGLRAFVFGSSCTPDFPLANRHGCTGRALIKGCISSGFFCPRLPLIRIRPLGLLWYWNPPMVRKSLQSESISSALISIQSPPQFCLSRPEWRPPSLFIPSYTARLQFFPKCHSNVSRHITRNYILLPVIRVFFLSFFKQK